ncbi:hypothetical protein [Actinomadura livida]|uniref:Uncharacterized protein n=1 Tax=Actinomadura livida TaxID=79909 RepID=A0A7W7N154_9ACTN|nr:MULTISPECIES: hypothetical protein [Actinomadura]MBB4777605.1 hypothetical protein [Actinomadura catellatispora]GGT99958.1 hypothetical protein GCM10010208_24700 [Actinomadura livida]
MQLPRVVIAAVFFVIGALIAIPALINGTSGESSASTSATTSGSPSPSESPSPSGTSATPAAPVTASIGSQVSCPARTVQVTVRNTGKRTEDFGIEKNDDTAAIPGEIPANSTRTVAVKLREDRTTRVTVNWANKRIGSATVKANCEKAGAAPAPTKTPPEELPNTGPDTVLWARGATGAAIILTGAIIFWYGGIWPRRREQVFKK